jgi:hypothetical protein
MCTFPTVICSAFLTGRCPALPTSVAQPCTSSNHRLSCQRPSAGDPCCEPTVEVRDIAVTQRVQDVYDERRALTRVAEHHDSTPWIEASAMPETVGIGDELDNASRHIHRTIDRAASQLVRLTNIDQHHVVIDQLCSQLGGTQVLDDGSCQSDLCVDVLDPRIISHASNRGDRRVPWPFPGRAVRPAIRERLGNADECTITPAAPLRAPSG